MARPDLASARSFHQIPSVKKLAPFLLPLIWRFFSFTLPHFSSSTPIPLPCATAGLLQLNVIILCSAGQLFCLDTANTAILALAASAFVERGNIRARPPAEKLPLNKQQSQRSHSANRKLQGYADEPFAPTLPLEPSVLCLHLQRIAFCKIG